MTHDQLLLHTVLRQSCLCPTRGTLSWRRESEPVKGRPVKVDGPWGNRSEPQQCPWRDRSGSRGAVQEPRAVAVEGQRRFQEFWELETVHSGAFAPRGGGEAGRPGSQGVKGSCCRAASCTSLLLPAFDCVWVS